MLRRVELLKVYNIQLIIENVAMMMPDWLYNSNKSVCSVP